jgi:hypothetical protein
MKTRLSYFLFLIPLFAGCNLLEDATKITISTELNADIPVVAALSGTKSMDLTANANAVSFSKTQDLTLASNADIEPYLSKIKEINLNSLLVTVSGLTGSQVINTVSLTVAGVGNIFTQNNITMTNNSFTPEISAGTFDLVAAKLSNDLQITLTVSGTTSEAMTFTISLSFESDVIATVL